MTASHVGPRDGEVQKVHGKKWSYRVAAMGPRMHHVQSCNTSPYPAPVDALFSCMFVRTSTRF